MRVSSRLSQARKSFPTGASASSTIRPSAAPSRPSSLVEHNMPNDSTPRTLATLISMPGNLAPGRAQGTLSPAAALGAPHTMVTGAASPTSTWHTRRRSASGCFSADRILATTTWVNGGAAGVKASTSSPAMVRAWASWGVSSAGLTRLRNQASENCMMCATGLVELLEEAEIVLEEQPQVVDAIAQHGEALDAEAEGKADESLGVDVDVPEDVGVHHAASQHLQPPGVRADAAAFAATHHAADVHYGRRFGERKERRPEAHRQIVALEEVAHEVGEHALQVGERHRLVDPQAFDLVEHRRVRHVGIAAVHPSRRNDAQRRLVTFHVAHLHRRGVGAQQFAALQIEGVVHRPCRMVFRNVERSEVVEIGLDFGAGRHLEADRAEQR